MKATACLLGVSLALATVPGCGKGPLKIVASCDMRGHGGSNSEICMDLTDRNLDKVKQLCDAQGNKWQTQACDRKGSLGGCRDDAAITWQYPSSQAKTADDVKKGCYGDAKYVPADWTEPTK
jgi:hypothetical protein